MILLMPPPFLPGVVAPYLQRGTRRNTARPSCGRFCSLAGCTPFRPAACRAASVCFSAPRSCSFLLWNHLPALEFRHPTDDRPQKFRTSGHQRTWIERAWRVTILFHSVKEFVLHFIH